MTFLHPSLQRWRLRVPGAIRWSLEWCKLLVQPLWRGDRDRSRRVSGYHQLSAKCWKVSSVATVCDTTLGPWVRALAPRDRWLASRKAWRLQMARVSKSDFSSTCHLQSPEVNILPTFCLIYWFWVNCSLSPIWHDIIFEGFPSYIVWRWCCSLQMVV